MLTIIMEDYRLGELYSEGFTKLKKFMDIVEQGIYIYLPKLSKYFTSDGSLIDLFVTQWIITLFTVDFCIEIAFCIIDMLLVHGWKAIYGVILSLLHTVQKDIVGKNEEETIMIIKGFVKDGNIDFETFFKRVQSYTIPFNELSKLGEKFFKIKLPEEILNKLAMNTADVELTIGTPKLSVDWNQVDGTDENLGEISVKKRGKNRIPRKFDSKDRQMRMSSVAPYKPFDHGKSPNPVQMTSDDDSEKKSVEKPVKPESMKFLIPNEGSINKSPMSLFTKATRVSNTSSYLLQTNAFCTSQGDIREKSLSFNAYPRLLDNKRSTTPQQKDYLHAQFLEQQ